MGERRVGVKAAEMVAEVMVVGLVVVVKVAVVVARAVAKAIAEGVAAMVAAEKEAAMAEEETVEERVAGDAHLQGGAHLWGLRPQDGRRPALAALIPTTVGLLQRITALVPASTLPVVRSGLQNGCAREQRARPTTRPLDQRPQEARHQYTGASG